MTKAISLRRVLTGLVPFSLAVQICSFASSIVLARVLGASSSTDAYYLGLSIPVASYAILLTAIRLGAIPALTERDVTGGAGSFERAAGGVVSATIVASFAMTFLVTVVAEAVVPLIVAGKTGDTARLVMLELAPLGVLGALTGALGAVLAVRRVFAPAVAVMTIEPVLKTILTLTLGHRIGINALVIGNVVGSAAAAVALWFWLGRVGVRLRFGWGTDTAFVRSVFLISAPLLVSQSVLQTNPIVDRTMASNLGAGSVTALEIGLRICLVPTALVTGLMITPITATWAERRLQGGWLELRRSVARAIAGIATFIPPVVVVGVLLRHEIVRLAYQGGAYSPHALSETTRVFGVTLFALPLQLIVVVLSTLFIVERRTVFPMLIGIANVVLNVGLNFALRPLLGVAGIALSTTLTIAILAAVYAIAAQRRWQAIDLRGHGSAIAFAALSTIAIAAVAFGLLRALPTATSRAQALLSIVSVAGVGFALHAVVVLVREPSLHYALRLRRAWIGTGA